MAKTRLQKQEMIQSLAEKIKRSKSVVFTSQRGLTVKDSTDLRSLCRKENAEYVAIKKTLLQKALSDAGIGSAEISSYDGIVGVVLGYDDEVVAARIASNFAKEHEEILLQDGILEHVLVDSGKIKYLATLPSKDMLIAKFIGSLNAPVSGFVRVLFGTMSGFVRVLDQIREQKTV